MPPHPHPLSRCLHPPLHPWTTGGQQVLQAGLSSLSLDIRGFSLNGLGVVKVEGESLSPWGSLVRSSSSPSSYSRAWRPGMLLLSPSQTVLHPSFLLLCFASLHISSACLWKTTGGVRTLLLAGLGYQLFQAHHRWAGALASSSFHAYPWWTRWFDTFPLPRWASTTCSSLSPSPPPSACPSALAPWICCCRLPPSRPRRHWQKYRH